MESGFMAGEEELAGKVSLRLSFLRESATSPYVSLVKMIAHGCHITLIICHMSEFEGATQHCMDDDWTCSKYSSGPKILKLVETDANFPQMLGMTGRAPSCVYC
jgi:hypothetical protein